MVDAHSDRGPPPDPATDIADLDRDDLAEGARIHHVERLAQNRALRAAQIEAEPGLFRHRSLFESLPVPAVVVDGLAVIQDANPAAAELFGFDGASRLREHSLYALIEDDDRPELARRIAATGDWDVPLELAVRAAHGLVVAAELHVVRLSTTYHVDGRTLVLFIDRSQHVEHRREFELFQALLDHAGVMVAAFDLEGRAILANSLFADSVGLSRSEVIGRRRSTWLGGAAAREEDRRDANVVASLGLDVSEELVRVGDGDEKRYVVQRFPLRDERGAVFAVGMVATDVTKSRVRDARLDLVMRLFAQGNEGIVATDSDNRILLVNPAFERITGYGEREVVGRNPSLLASGRHDREFYERMWAAIDAGDMWEGEIWNRRKSGEVYPEWLAVSRVKVAPAGPAYFVGVFSDISRRKSAEEEVERLAMFDRLTGIPNRDLLRDRTEQAIASAERSGDPLALVFIDLDGFKEINDVHGHEVGDQLLVEIAERLKREVRWGDTVARLGGDEFVLVLQGISYVALGERLEGLLDRVEGPMDIHGESIRISGSMGVAMYPEDGSDFGTLLRNADIAMYEAKHDGRNRFRVFDDRMSSEVRDRVAIATALRSAIENGELELHYQPEIDLESHDVIGVEALLRWTSPTLGAVPPDRFIPIAEQSGWMLELGDWVLETALTQMAVWRERGVGPPRVAVNVSAREFEGDGFVDRVAGKLAARGLPGDVLELEVTERVAMEHPEQSAERMRALTRLGVGLAIDDFGTGHSSLAYLQWMPVDAVKLDMTFVQHAHLGGDAAVICSAIITLAHSLDMLVVAEGVEIPAQEQFLQLHHCERVQGFMYARPMPATELIRWMSSREPS